MFKEKKILDLRKLLQKLCKIFRNSESIKKIKKSGPPSESSSFSFREISEAEVYNAMKDLPINKSTISRDIPVIILKQHAHIYSRNLTNIFTKSIKLNKFHDILKKTEPTPAYE